MASAMITPPAAEPVTMAQVKDHLRIDGADEDAWLADCVAAARVHVEHATGRKLLSQLWRQYAEGRRVRLEVGPVRSVPAVTAYDEEGEGHVLSPVDYELRDDVLCISRAIDVANGVEIDVEVGLAAVPVEVPPTLQRAVLMLVGHWHEFRGYVEPRDQPVSMPPGFRALVAPYARVKL